MPTTVEANKASALKVHPTIGQKCSMALILFFLRFVIIYPKREDFLSLIISSHSSLAGDVSYSSYIRVSWDNQ